MVPAPDIHRADQFPGGEVHRSWGAESNSGEVGRFQPGLLGGFDHGPAHPADGVFRPFFRLRGNGQPGERLAEVIDHADLDVGPSQVDAREKRRLGLIG